MLYRARGLIPAHAGKTPTASAARSTPRAHPRSRGENRAYAQWACQLVGSSPLTRGKPASATNGVLAMRLIPAHAGKTGYSPRNVSAFWAHPRSRGENHRLTSGLEDAGGSSPLTRGKHSLYECQYAQGGLIPAHAGKTAHRRPCRCSAWAHPRSRGENHSQTPALSQRRGSSPLTRGKRARCRSVGGASGLIPAHAGKTLRR